MATVFLFCETQAHKGCLNSQGNAPNAEFVFNSVGLGKFWKVHKANSFTGSRTMLVCRAGWYDDACCMEPICVIFVAVCVCLLHLEFTHYSKVIATWRISGSTFNRMRCMHNASPRRLAMAITALVAF